MYNMLVNTVEIDEAETGKRIRMYMEKRGYTVRQLTAITGLAETTIRDYMRGKYIPKSRNLVIIAIALGVNMDDIMVYREE